MSKTSAADRLLALIVLSAAPPAHALGEQVFLVLGLDILLLIVAIVVIAFALSCPTRMRAALVGVYLASLVLLFFLPVQIFSFLGALNALLHFAFPGLVTAAVFLAWRARRA